MSELAAAYYQERAERLAIGHIPDILNGEVVGLFEESQQIPVHDPIVPSDSLTAIAFRNQLYQVNRYIFAATPDSEQYPKGELSSVATRNRALSSAFVGRLLVPNAVKTGKISDVQIEALAREEVTDSVLKRIKFDSYPGIESDGATENTEVYLGVTGRLRSGSRKIVVGGIVLARSVRAYAGMSGEEAKYVTTIHHAGTPLRSNESSGRLIQRESRSVRDSVAEYNLRNPLQGGLTKDY